ncbi:MAG: hypothetical protein AAGD23_03395 [Pseudomonadota bacterium]
MYIQTATKTIAIAAVCAVSVISVGRSALDARLDQPTASVADKVHDIPGDQVSLFSAPQR